MRSLEIYIDMYEYRYRYTFPATSFLAFYITLFTLLIVKRLVCESLLIECFLYTASHLPISYTLSSIHFPHTLSHPFAHVLSSFPSLPSHPLYSDHNASIFSSFHLYFINHSSLCTRASLNPFSTIPSRTPLLMPSDQPFTLSPPQCFTK
jgi:hypothetical protein